MIYRFLGNTGLKVSVLSFGNFLTGHKIQEEQNQIAVMKAAFKAGINFFDTAEVYGFGVAETIMGKAIKEFKCPRKDLVISTKLIKGGNGLNDLGMSRKHIIEGMDLSLKRLDLDYVDLVFSHRPDYNTPLEETCRAFNTLVEQGKALYWGTSEWPAELIVEALYICDKFSLHKPVVEQCQYNMFVRSKMEKEYEWLFTKYKYGTTIWSPLAGGVLTGKYNEGIPQGSRLDQEKALATMNQHIKPGKKEDTVKKINALSEIAKAEGYTLAQLALAWTIVNQDTSTCIMGASKVSQLEENLKALELYHKWNPDIEEKCNQALKNTPETDLDFRTWKPRIERRSAALIDQAKKKTAKL